MYLLVYKRVCVFNDVYVIVGLDSWFVSFFLLLAAFHFLFSFPFVMRRTDEQFDPRMFFIISLIVMENKTKKRVEE